VRHVSTQTLRQEEQTPRFRCNHQNQDISTRQASTAHYKTQHTHTPLLTTQLNLLSFTMHANLPSHQQAACLLKQLLLFSWPLTKNAKIENPLSNFMAPCPHIIHIKFIKIRWKWGRRKEFCNIWKSDLISIIYANMVFKHSVLCSSLPSYNSYHHTARNYRLSVLLSFLFLFCLILYGAPAMSLTW